MNLVRFIKNKMSAFRPVRSTEETPDLALYRQLRSTENKLHEARESLNRKLASHQKSAHLCPSGAQNDQPAGESAQQDMLRPDIEHLRRDVARLEAEYQNAQMNVRAYFYLESCPGLLPESELTSGHPAQ